MVLHDLSKLPREEHIALCRKGGLVCSDKKKLAAKLRGLRMANDETIEKRAMELVASSNLSAYEIMRYLTELVKRDDLSDTLKVQLLGKMAQVHKAIHGDRQIQEGKQQYEIRWLNEEESAEKLKKLKEGDIKNE